MEKQTLYHGSNVIVEQPLVSIGRKDLDFGPGFDIVEGGVADNRVIDAVEAYINGYADVEHTLRQLVYHKPNHQICILSQEIVDKCLQFKSYERI